MSRSWQGRRGRDADLEWCMRAWELGDEQAHMHVGEKELVRERNRRGKKARLASLGAEAGLGAASCGKKRMSQQVTWASRGQGKKELAWGALAGDVGREGKRPFDWALREGKWACKTK